MSVARSHKILAFPTQKATLQKIPDTPPTPALPGSRPRQLASFEVAKHTPWHAKTFAAQPPRRSAQPCGEELGLSVLCCATCCCDSRVLFYYSVSHPPVSYLASPAAAQTQRQLPALRAEPRATAACSGGTGGWQPPAHLNCATNCDASVCGPWAAGCPGELLHTCGSTANPKHRCFGERFLDSLSPRPPSSHLRSLQTWPGASMCHHLPLLCLKLQ